MKISIKTKDIKQFWETKDVCIVEMKNGKKWVCKNTFEPSNDEYNLKWNTFFYILNNYNLKFICLELAEKGKSEHYGKK
jgi:hypothetical protein